MVKQVLYDAYVESERSLDEIIDLIRNADEWIQAGFSCKISGSSHINAKTKCEYVSFVFLFKDIEKMSRKLYDNRDKKGAVFYDKQYLY